MKITLALLLGMLLFSGGITTASAETQSVKTLCYRHHHHRYWVPGVFYWHHHHRYHGHGHYGWR